MDAVPLAVDSNLADECAGFLGGLCCKLFFEVSYQGAAFCSACSASAVGALGDEGFEFLERCGERRIGDRCGWADESADGLLRLPSATIGAAHEAFDSGMEDDCEVAGVVEVGLGYGIAEGGFGGAARFVEPLGGEFFDIGQSGSLPSERRERLVG